MDVYTLATPPRRLWGALSSSKKSTETSKLRFLSREGFHSLLKEKELKIFDNKEDAINYANIAGCLPNDELYVVKLTAKDAYHSKEFPRFCDLFQINRSRPEKKTPSPCYRIVKSVYIDFSDELIIDEEMPSCSL